MDKFNRHIHGERHTDLVEHVAAYVYDTIFNVFGARTDAQGNYGFFKEGWDWSTTTFPETTTVYEVPFSKALIKKARWISAAAVYVNDQKYETFESLTGITLEKGDKIRATGSPNFNYFFCLEMVVTIQTIKQ